MATHTEAEPKPRLGPPVQLEQASFEGGQDLPRIIREPDGAFMEVLGARRSSPGDGDLSLDDLSSLLWHTMMLRRRRQVGRFGVPWESRSAPSAGGLHATRLVVLPLSSTLPAGIYIPDRHALSPIPESALAANRASAGEMLGTDGGVTLQFAADVALLEACYENVRSLMWRDAGSLLAIICLIATALDLAAVPLGRTGGSIVDAAGMGDRFVGTGAVHLGGQTLGPVT